MIEHDRESILEEEIIILRNSGEIPEIALHSALYYLQDDEAGPNMELREEELQQLYDAALSRAREIVLRDLDPGNRDLGLYRGVSRSIANWKRLQDFCGRINRLCPGFRQTVAQALLAFMERECADIQNDLRGSCVNCSAEEIRNFCKELRLDPSDLPDGWTGLCG